MDGDATARQYFPSRTAWRPMCHCCLPAPLPQVLVITAASWAYAARDRQTPVTPLGTVPPRRAVIADCATLR